MSITSCISHKQFDYAPISSPKDLAGIYERVNDYPPDIIKVDYESDKRIYISRLMDSTWSKPTLYKGKFDKKKHTFDTWTQRELLPFIVFYNHDFSKDKIGKSKEDDLIINHAYDQLGILVPLGSVANRGSYITKYKPLKDEILLPTKIDNKWGYKDFLSRDIKIENIYDSVCSFQGTFARVMINRKWSLINKSGTIIANQRYDEIKPIEAGSMEIRNENKWGLLDSLGTEVVPCIYDKIYSQNYYPRNGFRKVELKGRIGLINKDYELILTCEYDEIYQKLENLFEMEQYIFKGLANESGVIFPPIFKQLELVSLAQYPDILATVYYQDKAYYIDLEGYLHLPKKTNFFRDTFSQNIPPPDYGNKFHYTELLKTKDQ